MSNRTKLFIGIFVVLGVIQLVTGVWIGVDGDLEHMVTKIALGVMLFFAAAYTYIVDIYETLVSDQNDLIDRVISSNREMLDELYNIESSSK